jgi:hypothetical protein
MVIDKPVKIPLRKSIIDPDPPNLPNSIAIVKENIPMASIPSLLILAFIIFIYAPS